MYILENSLKGQKKSQLLRKRKKSKHNRIIFDTKREEEYNTEKRNKYKTMIAVEFTSVILVSH